MRKRPSSPVAGVPLPRRRLGAAVAFGTAILCAGVLFSGCASPTPRADLETVAHVDNQAYLRYASTWSRHTFDSEPVVGRVAIVTADPALAARFAAADTDDDLAAAGVDDRAAIGGATDEAAGAETADQVAAAGAADAAAGARTEASQAGAGAAAAEHAGEVADDAAAGTTAEAAERGGVTADRAGAGHGAVAHAGDAQGRAHGAGADVAAVAAQAEARAAGAGADATLHRPRLVLRKTPSPAHALPGDRVRFTFHVHNPGPLVAERVRIIDELPADFQALDASGAELEAVDDGVHHLILSGRIPVGGSRSVTLETRLRGDALERHID